MRKFSEQDKQSEKDRHTVYPNDRDDGIGMELRMFSVDEVDDVFDELARGHGEDITEDMSDEGYIDDDEDTIFESIEDLDIKTSHMEEKMDRAETCICGLIGDTKKCKAAIGILFGVQLVLTAVLFCSHHKLGRDIRGLTGKGT